jgi:hypothetical protein
MSSENLDQTDLQGGDLSMHEDPGQVQLHLERGREGGREGGRGGR